MIDLPPFPLLLPVTLVVAGALVLLGLEPFLSQARKHQALPWIGCAALLAALAACFLAPHGSVHGLYAIDVPRMWLMAGVAAATLIGLAGMQQTLGRDRFAGGEPYALTLFSGAGAMLMVQAIDYIGLFVGLELASLAVYALVGLRRHRAESGEALFKYLVMGAVFTAIFLYGLALTYGATGSTGYGAAALAERSTLFLAGQALILIALLFKVGAVPFHFWSPDAYTGAPAAVTGLMGAIIKVGGFTALAAIVLNLVSLQLGGRAVLSLSDIVALPRDAAQQGALHGLHVVLILVAVLSLLIGTFGALRQNSLRRLFAFSAIAHSGYLLLILILPQDGGALRLDGLIVYLVAYALTTAGALSAIAALAGPDDTGDSITALAGSARQRPLHGLCLTIFLAGTAGLPPTLGFLGKFLVLGGLVAGGHVWIALLAMVIAIAGAGVYLRIVVVLWGGTAKAPVPAEGPSVFTNWAIAGAAAATIALLWPSSLTSMAAPQRAAPARSQAPLAPTTGASLVSTAPLAPR